jgi:Asp-tRNA(Asn)/Glu-tRNA(Gln) amidotransferase A subunit family amidase
MLDNFDAILPLRLRVAVPSDEYFADVEDDVKENFWNSIDLIKSNGAEIIPIDLSWLSIARPINVVITMAEAINVHKKWLDSRHEEYSYEVISRLIAGENLSINDYLSSLRLMNWVQKEMDKNFSNFDIIACPTTPELPGMISDYSKENLSASRKVIGGRIPAFTSLFNVTRQPSLSSLSGFSSKGLPIGIMFTGRFNNDFGVLQVGNWFEKINEEKRLMKPNL